MCYERQLMYATKALCVGGEGSNTGKQRSGMTSEDGDVISNTSQDQTSRRVFVKIGRLTSRDTFVSIYLLQSGV